MIEAEFSGLLAAMRRSACAITALAISALDFSRVVQHVAAEAMGTCRKPVHFVALPALSGDASCAIAEHFANTSRLMPAEADAIRDACLLVGGHCRSLEKVAVVAVRLANLRVAFTCNDLLIGAASELMSIPLPELAVLKALLKQLIIGTSVSVDTPVEPSNSSHHYTWGDAVARAVVQGSLTGKLVSPQTNAIVLYQIGDMLSTVDETRCLGTALHNVILAVKPTSGGACFETFHILFERLRALLGLSKDLVG